MKPTQGSQESSEVSDTDTLADSEPSPQGPVSSSYRKIFHFSQFSLDQQERRLTFRGEPVQVRPKVFSFFCLLIERNNSIVTRKKIANSLWQNDTYVSDATINHCAVALRKILSAQDEVRLETVRGVGFRLLGPVDVQELPESAIDRSLLVKPDEPGPTPVADDLQRPSRPWSSARRRWLLALTIGLALVALVGLIARSRTVDPTSRPLVLILGFEDLGASEGGSWLGTAIQELLQSELAKSSELVTLGAWSAEDLFPESAQLEWKEPTADELRLMRGYLGASLVAFGSYQEDHSGPAPELTINAKLVDTSTGLEVAAAVAAGSTDQLSALVTEIGDQIRQPLGMTFTRGATATAAPGFPVSGPALRLYSIGLEHLRQYKFQEAKDILEVVVLEEPGSPLAHAALSTAWLELGHDRRAAAEARHAVALATNVSRESLLSIQASLHIAEHSWSDAEAVFASLWRFCPENPEHGLQLAKVQLRRGAAEKALRTLAEISDLRHDPRANLIQANAARQLERYEQARDLALAAIENAQSFGSPLMEGKARLALAKTYHELGRGAQAIDEADSAAKLFAQVGCRKEQAATLRFRARTIRSGPDLAEAEQLLRQALAIERELGRIHGIAASLIELAAITTQSNRQDESIQYLQEAIVSFGEAGDSYRLGIASLELAELVQQSQVARADSLCRHAVEIFDDLGAHEISARARSQLSGVLIDLGKIEEAETTAAEAVRRALDAQQQPGCLARALAAQVKALIAGGHLDEAERTLLRLEDHAGAHELVDARPQILTARSHLAALRGDWTDALERASEAIQAQVNGTSPSAELIRARLWQAELMLELGQVEGCQHLIEQINTELRSVTDPNVKANAEYVHARLLAEQGATDQAGRRVTGALDLPIQSWEQAKALQVLQARLLRLDNRAGEARLTLQEVVEDATLKRHRHLIFMSGLELAKAELALGQNETAAQRLIGLWSESERTGFTWYADQVQELLDAIEAGSVAQDLG